MRKNKRIAVSVLSIFLLITMIACGPKNNGGVDMSNLKELKAENFKNGVVTKITGFIPKFKFEYELNLKEELKNIDG